MPVRYLTDEQRRQADQFPEDIPAEEIIRYFTLSGDDLKWIRTRRGDDNRLGVAVQLGCLRLLGFSLSDLTQIPPEVIRYVAHQIGVRPTAWNTYGDRVQTRTGHAEEVRQYLGFRACAGSDYRQLVRWLTDRSLEHDKPSLLLRGACDWLKDHKILRLAITRMEWVVARARSRASRQIWATLEPQVTPELRGKLDGMLIRAEGERTTAYAWLRKVTTGRSAEVVLDAIRKLRYLRDLGADTWDTAMFPPLLRKRLAQIAQRITPDGLRRMAPERRYPLLFVFLRQELAETADEILDLLDKNIVQIERDAADDHADWLKTVDKARREKMQYFGKIAGVILDEGIPDQAIRREVYRQVPKNLLAAAVADVPKLIKPDEGTVEDRELRRYSKIRRFLPDLLETMPLASHVDTHPVMQAIEIIRELEKGNWTTKVPDQHSVPVGFVTGDWKDKIYADDGRVLRKPWEYSVVKALRGAFRSGDIWLPVSRRYADPESYLIPQDKWPAMRSETCAILRIEEDVEAHLRRKQEELNAKLELVDRHFPDYDEVRLTNEGALVVTPLERMQESSTLKALRDEVLARLPRVDLADILVEVGAWTRFPDRLERAGGTDSRTPDLLQYLYGVIIALACNLGLQNMNAQAGLRYSRLLNVFEWYLREENVRLASADIVQFQRSLPLAKLWGDTTWSSSDGQRFPVRGEPLNAEALSRYMGPKRMLTLYTWTTDQWTGFGAKVVPVTARDAAITLDALLDNPAELPIKYHTTDTAGYTDMMFALYAGLGRMKFAPRIKDLGDLRFFKWDSTQTYKHIGPLLRNRVQVDQIREHWDDILRVLGSLKRGWVTASLLTQKLQSFPRQNRLLKALQAYGQIEKTMFLLDYIHSEEFRRDIQRQLNKGESLHALRRFLFYGTQGQIRYNSLDDQTTQGYCLMLITNAVVAWNTVYIQAVLDQLRSEGYPVNDDDVRHLAPLMREHINPYGKIQFDMDRISQAQPLRPLRDPKLIE